MRADGSHNSRHEQGDEPPPLYPEIRLPNFAYHEDDMSLVENGRDFHDMTEVRHTTNVPLERYGLI